MYVGKIVKRNTCFYDITCSTISNFWEPHKWHHTTWQNGHWSFLIVRCLEKTIQSQDYFIWKSKVNIFYSKLRRRSKLRNKGKPIKYFTSSRRNPARSPQAIPKAPPIMTSTAPFITPWLTSPTIIHPGTRQHRD